MILLHYIFTILPLLAVATTSPKRGLVYVGNNKNSINDISAWTSNTDLTWYYNYASSPVSQLSGSSLQFVPMLWGTPASGQDTQFLNTVTAQQKSENITHVLGFNEPDLGKSVGGSNMAPSDASTIWQKQLEPLRRLGIKVGAPAVSGSPTGYAWLKQWIAACKGKCNPDFLPVHWYGDFEGLASWIGNMSSTYPELEIWVTEFALPNAGLADTQAFFNQSVSLLDGWANVTRYSYFGAFRSDTSNIGPNAAMLSAKGALTDVGSWYLGEQATGAKPSSAVSLMGSSSKLMAYSMVGVMVAFSICL